MGIAILYAILSATIGVAVIFGIDIVAGKQWNFYWLFHLNSDSCKKRWIKRVIYKCLFQDNRERLIWIQEENNE